MNTCTKTEVDTLLFNSSSQAFSAISRINLVLGLSYKTATHLAEAYYNKSEVDSLITFDPNVVYTKTEINSILISNYSSVDGRGQLFLAYSSTNQITEAYYDKAETDYLLANKVSTTGTGDATISGNLDVDKVLTLRIPGVSDTSPLVIINDGPGGGTGVIYQSTASGQGFLIAYITAQSSVAWEEGVNWGGANDFLIKSGSNGLTIKPNGGAVLSGSSTQNSDASLKGNVEDVGITDCTDMLGNINVKTYTRNDMEEGNTRSGFIAQDVKAYLPDRFDNIIGSNIIADEQGEKPKEIMTMDYARMVCVLWKIVQNQNERFMTLESK